MSAAFSAIITTGTLVLPETSVGITEQSTTRKPLDAVHAQPLSRTASGSLAFAHLAGAARVEDRGAVVAAELEQVGVGRRAHGAGPDLALARNGASPATRRVARAALTPATGVARSSSVAR